LTDEMDFQLVIGNLGDWDIDPIYRGRYYPELGIIAVDNWTGEEEVEYMADILSHEFLHHLLRARVSWEAGAYLDNIRMVTEEEIRVINEKGIEKAWGYMSNVAKFALCCAALSGVDYTVGNGVL
jgi:hypothetical protein